MEKIKTLHAAVHFARALTEDLVREHGAALRGAKSLEAALAEPSGPVAEARKRFLSGLSPALESRAGELFSRILAQLLEVAPARATTPLGPVPTPVHAATHGGEAPSADRATELTAPRTHPTAPEATHPIPPATTQPRTAPRSPGTLLGLGGTETTVVRGFRVIVLTSPDQGTSAEARDGRLTVGSERGNLLQLSDRTVSRFHLELEVAPGGVAVSDLGSTNGTRMGGMFVRDVTITGDVELELGAARVRVELAAGPPASVPSAPSSFGALLGSSAAMRTVYAILGRAAPTSAPVLITGESGTGKELAARAVHDASPRADKPFEVVDCGGLPPSLIENELFGHERGAFTHALGAHEGAFERADGGTLFLDELGELPLELQPKLLRVLGQGETRRIGAQKSQRVDVRVVAATNRDLRREVNSGRFRGDLYYRVAVLEVRMPPLRERFEDLPALVPALLQTISSERGIPLHLRPSSELYGSLRQQSWPGNVRELRNYLEQLVILEKAPSPHGHEEPPLDAGPSALSELTQLPMRLAKAAMLERFERDYLAALLSQTGGNVAEAARRAGVDRRTLFRAIRRYGIRARDDDGGS
jgi:DNA-binding NtrC family response regulator